MTGERILHHFAHPQNVGELPPPAVTVEVVNPACGDILRLSAVLEDGRVAKVAFKTRGCVASIAASSVLTEMLLGKERAVLQGIRPSDIDDALGGLPPESKHAGVLCVDAVRALLSALS